MLFYQDNISLLAEATKTDECKADRVDVAVDASRINDILSKMSCLDHTILGATLESVRINAGEEGTNEEGKFFIAYSELAEIMKESGYDEAEVIERIEDFYESENVPMKDNLYVVIEADEQEIMEAVQDAKCGGRLSKVTLGKMADTLERMDSKGVRIVRGPNLCVPGNRNIVSESYNEILEESIYE